MSTLLRPPPTGMNSPKIEVHSRRPCRVLTRTLLPKRVWLWDACAERERPSFVLPYRRSVGIWRRGETTEVTICCTPGLNGDEDGGTDVEEETTTILTGTIGCEPEFDGALEFLLHFARGGGTAVLSNLAAACDATYIACKSIPQSLAPTAPLRRVSEIKGTSPDMTRAAAQIAPAEAIRLIAARAARGCLKVHDTCVSGRTFLSESDIKKASKKTERYASTAVSEIRAVGNVLKKRGQTAEIRRRVRRAERAGVERVLEALALAVGILHIAQADTNQNGPTRTNPKAANIDPGVRRSASVRIGRYTKKQAAAWGLI